MDQDTITHGPVSRIAFQRCRCSRCGIEERCTPAFDFYVRSQDPEDGPLFCYTCLVEDAGLAPERPPAEEMN